MRLDVQVRRNGLADVRVAASERSELRDGQALLRVDKFALTANNVTYAVLGDALDYWAFFPVDRPWGSVPAWGFADVVCSRTPALEEGSRVYGFVPMSTHLTVSPARPTVRGFVDVSPHRADLAGAYNWYQRSARRKGTAAASGEDRFALLRPLFVLSFLLAEHLHANRFFGAGTVVLSSASSKAAVGTAFHLARLGGVATIGLTSADRTAFVEGLQLYDQVATYHDVRTLPVSSAVYVDFSGSEQLLTTMRSHHGNDLLHSTRVGGTRQHQPWATKTTDPDPAHPLFSAPLEMAARTRDWGRAGFEGRLEEAWEPFVESSAGWLSVDRQRGVEALTASWLALVRGTVEPSVGHIRSVVE